MTRCIDNRANIFGYLKELSSYVNPLKYMDRKEELFTIDIVKNDYYFMSYGH